MSRTNTVKKKNNKRRKRKKLLLFGFLILVVALLIGLSFTVFFPVMKITVSGSRIYSYDEIISNCGINKGDNLLRINEDKVLSSLQKALPFIDSASVSKKLPGELKISVIDAEEIYLYNIGEEYYSTDKKGRVLKKYNEIVDNLLLVKCNVALTDDEIKHIQFENEKQKEIISFLNEHSENFKLTAEYIDLTDLYAVEMSFDTGINANFGEFIYFEEKLAHLFKMLETKELANSAGDVNLSQYTPENPRAFFVKKELTDKNS